MTRPRRSPEDLKVAKEVGLRLLGVREMTGLSQAEFVARLGRGTQRALAHYEAGKVLVPSALVRRICEVYDVSFDWLMVGRGSCRQTDVIRDAQARRAEVEARETLRAVQEVVLKYASENQPGIVDRSLDDLFRRALRISLGRLERDFNEKRGCRQFAAFLEDLVVTVREIWGSAGKIRKDVLEAASRRADDKFEKEVDRHLFSRSHPRQRPKT